MKLRIILFILFVLPLVVKGQSDVIFYSEAPMYVGYGTNTSGESASTALYVSGSAKFANNAAIKQKGRTELTGDFVNAKDPDVDNAAGTKNLFIDKASGDNEKTGIIAFIGRGEEYEPGKYKATLQRIYGAVPNGYSGTFDFTKQKTVNWINFPSISVEKGGVPVNINDDWRDVGYVAVDLTAAISVDYLNAKGGNRFAVNSSYDNSVGGDPRILNSGHARIYNTYSDMTQTDLATYSQVNLKMYKYDGDAVIDDDGAFNNSGSVPVAETQTFGKTLRNTEGWNYLTGFTPPFKGMGADYMFYHTLVKPNWSSITSAEGPIVDPFYRLATGVGYFTSMEVSHNDHDFINERWDFDGNGGATGIHDSRRARGGYVFNRLTFQDYLSKPTGYMDQFSRFLYDEAEHSGGGNDKFGRPIDGLRLAKFIEKDKEGVLRDRSRYDLMEDEKFNTESVVVKLTAGLNFLGNPFMAPISLNPLLGFDAEGNETYTDSQMSAGVGMDLFTPAGAANNVMISSKTITDVRAKYWLINEASIKYDDQSDLYLYKAKYDYISRNGATLAIEVGQNNEDPSGSGSGATLNGIKPLEYRIAPMQMFCLQASRPVNIKLDMSLCAFGETHYLKSAEAATTGSSIMRDWFVIEARNKKENAADRTSVVFRDDAKPQYTNDSYDTRKGLSKEIEEFIPEYNGKKTKTKYMGSTGIVYTKSSDGENLLGNAVPGTTKELALFFIPPSTTQEITLRFYGLENVESVSNVWLIDRYLNNKTTKLSPGDEYTFVSDAADANNAVDNNRFILRFYDSDNDIIKEDENPITCYYNTSVLYLSGLNEDDIDSNVQIYDLQGRLIGKTKINNAPSMEYLKPLSLGTYIVKITGKRNYTTKFVNLKN